MRYFNLLLILILTSCSLDKDSTFWNEDPIRKSIEKRKLSKILKKNGDYKTMTYDEFNLFLNDYSDSREYPDIND